MPLPALGKHTVVLVSAKSIPANANKWGFAALAYHPHLTIYPVELTIITIVA